MQASRVTSLTGILWVLMLVLTGCTGHNVYRQAQLAEHQGDWDQAVLHYLEAVRRHPEDLSYRTALLRAKIQASQGHFRKGQQFHQAGVLERAMVEFRQAVELDPTNQYAESELRKILAELRALRENEERPASIAEMKERMRGVRAQPPVLNPRSKEPIDLTFPDPISVLDIYRALGKAFGINVLFDPKIKDTKTTIELVAVTAQDALEILMRSANHFYKVLDEHSIIIADDTPQNRRTYEDQVIQTFFLSNAQIKDVMTMVRSLIGAKNVAANEQLNAIVLRDTADKVKVAEQIILSNDKAKAEVLVDVELLQIDTNKLRDLGFDLSSNQITANLDLGGEDVPLRVSDLKYLNQNNWVLTVPNFIFNFMKSSSYAQTLAQPKLRITEGEKATLTIGDRVPIPTTTFNTSNVSGSNIVPVTSFQYQDVGIKIEIEPRVHHNDEITLKLRVEVSDISGAVQGSGGQSQPVIGTRTIESNIRLRDGETNFLAGLIRSNENQTESGVPGLSEVPLLGRLFKNVNTTRQRTDIVLTLTPRIVRRADITEADLTPIWVGTETNITFRGGSPRVESPNSGPFDSDESAREAVRERLRQRLRNLPRGLQQVDGSEKEEPDALPEGAQPGIDLAPSGGPDDVFRHDDKKDGEEDDE